MSNIAEGSQTQPSAGGNGGRGGELAFVDNEQFKRYLSTQSYGSLLALPAYLATQYRRGRGELATALVQTGKESKNPVISKRMRKFEKQLRKAKETSRPVSSQKTFDPVSTGDAVLDISTDVERFVRQHASSDKELSQVLADFAYVHEAFRNEEYTSKLLKQIQDEQEEGVSSMFEDLSLGP